MNRALQEKRTLVELARRFGQEPAPRLLEELAILERDEEQRLKRESDLRERIATDLNTMFRKAEINELVQPSPEPAAATPAALPVTLTETPADQVLEITVPTPRLQDAVADYIKRNVRESTVVNPEPVLAQPQRDLEREVKYLKEWVGKIAATGPGGGEVNLRYLDDVDRSTIDDGQYLRYNAPTKKFVFDHGTKNIYYGAFQSNVTQTSSATSATAIACEIMDYSRGVSMTSNGITSSISRIVIAHPGTYNLQFSAQLVNSGNAIDPVFIWYRQNGMDIQQTNSQITVPGKQGNVDGAIIAGWNFFIRTTNVNEYIELMWFVADQTHTFIAATTSQAATATTPFLPSIPSIILTVNEITIDNS
jgi:hypothetical protein